VLRATELFVGRKKREARMFMTPRGLRIRFEIPHGRVRRNWAHFSMLLFYQAEPPVAAASLSEAAENPLKDAHVYKRAFIRPVSIKVSNVFIYVART
jgi:hypothetical protein